MRQQEQLNRDCNWTAAEKKAWFLMHFGGCSSERWLANNKDGSVQEFNNVYDGGRHAANLINWGKVIIIEDKYGDLHPDVTN